MGAITYWSSGSAGGIQNTEFYGNTIYVSSATRGGAINIRSGTIYNTGTYNNIIMTVPGQSVLNATKTSGGWDLNPMQPVLLNTHKSPKSFPARTSSEN